MSAQVEGQFPGISRLYLSVEEREGQLYASVTQFTVDFRGDDFDVAQETFERNVLPELRKQVGYEGCYLLRTTRGAGIIIFLWEDEAAAQASESGGPLVEQLQLLMPNLGKVTQTGQRFLVGLADHPVEPD